MRHGARAGLNATTLLARDFLSTDFVLKHSGCSERRQQLGRAGTARDGKLSQPCSAGTGRRAFRAQPVTVNHVFA